MAGYFKRSGAAAMTVCLAIGLSCVGLRPDCARAAGAPALVPLCASCHGEQGISSSPIIPSLAGQQQGYLSNALHDYKTKQRQGGSANMMTGLAAHLSDADIAALSAYYAALNRN